MIRSTIPFVVSLLAAAAAGGGIALVAEPAPAPILGPRGVIDTVQRLITAMDRGDFESLAAILDVQRAGGGGVVIPDSDSKWGFKEIEGDRSPRFVDVAWYGAAFAEHDQKQFIHRVRDGISAAETKARGVATRIISIRADCPSADVSYAVIEFERNYTVEGERQGVSRLLATALMRHVKKAKDSDPSFRIFQWHASRVSPRKVAETKKGE